MFLIHMLQLSLLTLLGKFSKGTFVFPGFPNGPGPSSDGPIGFKKFDEFPSDSKSVERGPLVFSADSTGSEIDGSPDDEGLGGRLNICKEPGISNEHFQFAYPGAPRAPLGYLNFTLLPENDPLTKGNPLIFLGSPNSPFRVSKNHPGGFLPSHDIPTNLRMKFVSTFSFPDLIKALEPLFPKGKINVKSIPERNLHVSDGKFFLPGFKGTYDNIQLDVLRHGPHGELLTKIVFHILSSNKI